MLSKFNKIELITPNREYFKILSQVPKMDKETLRLQIEKETAEYLKTNQIVHLADSPSAKVPEVYIRDLSAYSDAAEFYYLEENLDNDK